MKHCTQKGHYLCSASLQAGKDCAALTLMASGVQLEETSLSPTAVRGELWKWLGVRRQFSCWSLPFPSLLQSAELLSFGNLLAGCSWEQDGFCPCILWGWFMGDVGTLCCPAVAHSLALNNARCFFVPLPTVSSLCSVYQFLPNAFSTLTIRWKQLTFIVFFCCWSVEVFF